MAIDRDACVGQVLAYLEPEYQSHYGSREAWERLQEDVVVALTVLQP